MPVAKIFSLMESTLIYKKYFGMVNHEILLRKLKHYRISAASYKWFQSFLCLTTIYSDQRERTITNNNIS